MDLKYIVEELNGFPERKVLFENPIPVKDLSDRLVFTVFGAWADEQGVWLQDGAGEWHGPLEESQLNASYIINALSKHLNHSILT